MLQFAQALFCELRSKGAGLKKEWGKSLALAQNNGASTQDRRRDGAHGRVARAKAHSKAELWKWGRRGGRPGKLDRKGLATLKRLLATGTTQAECAAILGVSVRTIGRAVAQMRP
jgi:hypothetical protein